jgi:predicted DNA-binding transcriptional regulator YafY
MQERTAFGRALSSRQRFPDKVVKRIGSKIESGLSIPSDVLKPLLQALLDCRVVKLKYKKRAAMLDLEVVPLRLVSNLGIPYLLVFDLADDKTKTFAVNKILSVSRSHIPAPEKEVDAAIAYVNGAWGIMIGRRTAEIVFEVDDDVVAYFEAQSLHPSQRIEKTQRKNLVYIPVHDIMEFVRWSLRFGTHIRIISPDEAIEQAKKYCTDMIKFYGGG